jgi:aspartate-semialdehyde dehydrogenase
MSYNVAVVGATGNVGREILKILAERKFPVKSMTALASRQSLGTEISFGDDKTVKCLSLENFAGAVVIDNSSAYRLHKDVPLIIPEVNESELGDYTKKNIIANGNCVALPLCVALKPLDTAAKIKRIVVSTYQSTSGAGREAMDELYRQTRDVFMNNTVDKEVFTKQIAFNVIPHIDEFCKSGQTGEEEKVASETQKILGREIPIFATCVRVPTFIGHAISAAVEFENPLSDQEARDILKKAPGITLFDKREDAGYITPLDAANEDAVYVSRIRQDPSVKHGLGLWIVSDNLRKGAALNAVQIAESLVKNYLSK